MKTKYVIHKQGETFVVYDSRLEKRKTRLVKKIGTSFLLGAFIGLIIFLSPIFLAELNYRLNKASPSEIKFSRFGQLLWLDKKGILSPADWDFSLIIPKISLNTIVKSSVDLSHEEDYQAALKTGVAHAQGTALPDEHGTVYIFGHSTDYPWNISSYNAHFYPLKYLDEGEEVIVIYQGKNYLYRVEKRKIIEARELEYLVSQNNEDKLILQTCWPPGTTWKRLIVVASPIGEI